MNTKSNEDFLQPAHDYSPQTPATTTASAATNMTSTTDIICYIPWICAFIITAREIGVITDSLSPADKDPVLLSFLYATFTSFLLFKVLKEYIAKHIGRSCARLEFHNYTMRDFCSAAGIVTYILMQYGCAMLAVVLCLMMTDCSPGRITSHCVLVAVLMTYLQRQVPSRAAAVRFTIVFMLVLASAGYVMLAAYHLPQVAKYAAKWL